MLENFDVTSIWLLIVDKKDVLTCAFVHDLDGRRVRELALPEFRNVAGATYDRDIVVAPVDIGATGSTPRRR